MSALAITAIFVVGLVAGLVVFLALRRKPAGLDLLQNQIHEMQRVVEARFGESAKMIQTSAYESNRIISDVTERLTKLDETNSQVVNFADQLARLQDILKNPKQRGVFGEYYLDTLLSKAFQPNQYQMQYKFRDGEIVDAALFFGDKIIIALPKNATRLNVSVLKKHLSKI